MFTLDPHYHSGIREINPVVVVHSYGVHYINKMTVQGIFKGIYSVSTYYVSRKTVPFVGYSIGEKMLKFSCVSMHFDNFKAICSGRGIGIRVKIKKLLCSQWIIEVVCNLVRFYQITSHSPVSKTGEFKFL